MSNLIKLARMFFPALAVEEGDDQLGCCDDKSVTTSSDVIVMKILVARQYFFSRDDLQRRCEVLIGREVYIFMELYRF
ncbi:MULTISPECIES: hypothetical protein [unclassified Pseudomonas]|uniref:hypothetical protein n=1 Tax=unclassified Pseudomonas TaxID=196821 RepID=UPI0008380654|nr:MULTISPECIES: hypothetical protein [unclassified Pseudomonas]